MKKFNLLIKAFTLFTIFAVFLSCSHEEVTVIAILLDGEVDLYDNKSK